MKNKSAKIVAVLTVVGLMAAGSVAYAMSEGDNPENGKDRKSMPNQTPLDALDLTPAQRQAFQTLSDPAQQQKTQEIAQLLKIKMQALNVAVAEPGTTLTDVSDLIEETASLQSQMFSKKLERIFAMKKILTPEQFLQMQEIDKQRMNQKPEGPGGRGPGPDQAGSEGNKPQPDQEGSGGQKHDSDQE